MSRYGGFGVVVVSISELAPRIRGGEVSPVELTEAALARAEVLQPALNSFITLLGEQALAQAREEERAMARGEYKGPLQGIPIGVKDNLATAGVRTTVGSKVLADYVPAEDAEAVRRCRAAGAVILGKENLEEFAAGATSNNPHYGAVRNPWATEHIPGGSSGGGGANVAAGVTFASLGTDLGGSVRLPGAFCGVVGLKQTFGRVSQRGLLVTSYNGDHIGPMTRSVADSAIMLQAMAGHDPLDPSTVPVPVPDYSAALGLGAQGLRVGVPANYYFDDLEPAVGAAARQAIGALEELGAVTSPVELPMMRYIGAVRLAAMADSFVAHEPMLRERGPDYGPDVLYRTLGGQFVLGQHYAKALKAQRFDPGGVCAGFARRGCAGYADDAVVRPADRCGVCGALRGKASGAGAGFGAGVAQYQPAECYGASGDYGALRGERGGAAHRVAVHRGGVPGGFAVPGGSGV